MLYFSCILLLLIQVFAEDKPLNKDGGERFPKILWSYWHQGLESASTFTKMCLNNQRHFAQASGWQFKITTHATIHQYLDRNHLESLYAKLGPNINMQSKADIIRLSLLLKYGGMWMDANSFFIQDFSWIEQLKEYKQIKNKFGPYPEVVMSANHNHPFIQRHIQYGEKIQSYPNYENWLMISKPNSTFFQDVMIILEKVASMGRLAANEYYGQQGVALAEIYTDSDYFLMSNYLFQVVIQTKQKALDKQTPKRYAVQYYNIWSFEAAETALMLQSFYDYRGWPFVSDIQKYPLSVYKSNFSGPNFLIKLTGWHYPTLNDIFDNYIEYNCWNMSHIVREGSIIYEYLIVHSQELSEAKKIMEFNLELSQKRTGSYCSNKLEDYQLFSPFLKKLLAAFLFATSLISFWRCCWGWKTDTNKKMQQIMEMEEGIGLYSNRVV